LLVEADIGHDDGVGRGDPAVDDAATRAPHAPHLEDVGEIAAEIDGGAEADGGLAIVFQGEPVIGGVLPEENVALDMDGVLFQDQLAIGENVGVGQLHCEERIVVPHIGAEQQRMQTVYDDFEIGQEARVAVE
jgi:hypothetical protein